MGVTYLHRSCTHPSFTSNLNCRQAGSDHVALLHRVFEHRGVKLVTDDISLDFVKGATIDYVQELIKSTFEVCSAALQ